MKKVFEAVRKAVDSTPVSVSCKTGDMDMDCHIASGMVNVMDEIYRNMNDACYLILDKITIKDIDNKIFQTHV